MRIGILGGSFDPIHHGHLILARAAREELGLDRVIFVPAHVSPHKTGTPPAAPEDRLAMVRLAVENEPGFEASDIELRRDPPSFTVDTLREFKDRHPDDELVLLIGADNAKGFHTWKDPDGIGRLASLAVLDRAGGASEHGWPVIRRQIDISSTDIRVRVATGRSIRYLTPGRVCDYIASCGLYRQT